MRRLLALAMSLLLGATLRAGVVVAPPPDPSPTVNRANLQACIDLAGVDPAHPGNGGEGIVRLGAGTWTIDGPLFMDRRSGMFASVGLQGEGGGLSRIEMKRFTGRDVLVVGIGREPRLGSAPPVPLDPAHFVANAGAMDASAAGRVLFRTLSRVRLAQQGGCLDQGPAGDWYGSLRRFTIDCAVRFDDLDSMGNAFIYSLMDEDWRGPYRAWMVNGRPVVSIGTVGADPSDPASITTRNWQLDVGRPFEVGVMHRISVQADLDSPAMVAAWIDGHRATLTQSAGPPPKAGEVLYANQRAPFVLGGPFAVGGAGTKNLSFGGFKFTCGPLYTGDVQARIDGAAITDDRTYFRAEAAPFGLFALNESGAQVAADRLATVWGTSAPPSIIESDAAALDVAAHAADMSNYNPGRIADVAIGRGDAWQGRGVAVGRVGDLKIARCRIDGGAYAIGATPLGTVFPVLIDDCRLSGRDAPVYLFFASMVRIRDCLLADPYRAGFRFVYCSASIADVMSPHWGTADFGVYADKSSVRLRGVAFDNEGQGGTRRADVYNTPMVTNQPLAAILDVDQVDSVTGLPGSCVILLGGSRKTTSGYCGLRLRGVASRPGRRATVRVLRGAEEVWTDEGMILGSNGGPSSPDYEGLPLLAPKPVNTSAGVAPPR